MTRICIFGCYQVSEYYSRNTAIINAISSIFDETIVIGKPDKKVALANYQQISSPIGILKYMLGKLGCYSSIINQRKLLTAVDWIYIPYPAYLDNILLTLLLSKRNAPKLCIDAFICLRDTAVNDRKILQPNGILDKLLTLLERSALKKADVVCIDTEQQRDHLAKQYAVEKKKFCVLPVGVDEILWKPLVAIPAVKKFRVIFWSTFIPLHGIQTIIEAAEIVAGIQRNIRFKLIGDGQMAPVIKEVLKEKNLDNVLWDRRMLPASRLREEVKQSHCVLGIFGDTEKAKNVIPFKVAQALASNRIVITGDSPAINTITFGKDYVGLVLVPMANGKELAKAIMSVYKNYTEIWNKVSTRTLYEECLSSSVSTSRLVNVLR